MVTAPPPYSPRGIWPWKVAYSSGWSSVCTARWFCAGSSGTPFGSAQETSTPPRSSRKSQCSRRAWCSCTTKMPACPPVPSGSPSGTGSGVRAGSRLPRYSASRSTPGGYPGRGRIYQRWCVAYDEFWMVSVFSGRSYTDWTATRPGPVSRTQMFR